MSVIYIMSNTAYNDKNGDSEEPFNFQPKVTFHDIEDSEATDANDRLQEFIRNKFAASYPYLEDQWCPCY